MNHKGTTHELWESIKHTFGDSSTWDDDKFKKEDEPKEDAHEGVEHDHDLVIVEDAPPHGQVMMIIPLDHLTRLMMMPQVMQMMMLPHEHLMVMMMVHARAMKVMLLQALHHHHIASCHKVTQRYKVLMWLIMLIHMMSLLVDLLA